MSWSRQIKILQSICTNMFFYIIWGIVSYIILSNKVDYRLFLIALASNFLAQFIFSKWVNKALILIPVFTGVVLVYLISKGSGILFNSIFIVFSIYVSSSFDNEEINYDVYKARAKQALSLILVIGLVLPIIDSELTKSILKFYIMFVATIIWALREARSYSYKLRSKNSFKVSIGLTAGMLLLSVDKVFSVLMKFFILIFTGISRGLEHIANFILDCLGLILSRPLQYIVDHLQPIFAKSKLFKNQNVEVKVQENNELIKRGGEGFVPPIWLTNLIKLVLLILILYIVYRFLLKDKFYKSGHDGKIVEEKREKIKRDKRSGNFLTRAIQNLITPKDFRSQILNVYRKFETKTFEKGIYKSYMTAKQLENHTRVNIENPQGINNLTEIYNEAKFSNHGVSEDKVKIIKEEFNNVKKQL
ncbi:toxin secretion/phage lysis holin [Clostridiales bacterium oral taxon 876 str. F0540]|nr:toxin secretion/phage lysis holin [Clostridiales bacterium oral taxon 876 str. F0540]